MATYLERANGIVEAGIDGVPTAEQKQRIAESAILFRHDLLLSLAADPLNPTGEEKAAVFVEAFREWAVAWLRNMAEKQTISANVPNVQAAGDVAAADLSEP
jgi:hypothetical protein